MGMSHARVDLLKEMGTWETVQKPLDAVPITNKWVFIKKWNKQGEVVRHKARLVIKGCAQHPGYDYLETFSPVVRMDMLCAILAFVAEKGLQMQQMDVKGAYLNGTLKETIYIRQPEGCEDGIGHVCRLVKPLYGLKQAVQV
jgi:Reverse transcriptase (RNA-dependent DNA polymerase)